MVVIFVSYKLYKLFLCLMCFHMFFVCINNLPQFKPFLLCPFKSVKGGFTVIKRLSKVNIWTQQNSTIYSRGGQNAACTRYFNNVWNKIFYFINIILDNTIIFIVIKKSREDNYCHKFSIHYSSYQAPSWLLLIASNVQLPKLVSWPPLRYSKDIKEIKTLK
jgi:hypothetical protein